jgi:hypothetical protein
MYSTSQINLFVSVTSVSLTLFVPLRENLIVTVKPIFSLSMYSFIVRFHWFSFGFKVSVFWNVAQGSLLEIYCCYRGATYCLYHCPDDGGSKHLWNIGQLLPDCIAQHSRRQWSLYSSLWELQCLLNKLKSNCKKQKTCVVLLLSQLLFTTFINDFQ